MYKSGQYSRNALYSSIAGSPGAGFYLYTHSSSSMAYL
jgi:hypothetical protein